MVLRLNLHFVVFINKSYKIITIKVFRSESIMEETQDALRKRSLNPKFWSIDQTMDYIASKEKSLCKYLPYLKEQVNCI